MSTKESQLEKAKNETTEFLGIIKTTLTGMQSRINRLEEQNKEIIEENREIKEFLFQTIYGQREIAERLRYWPYVKIKAENETKGDDKNQS